MKATVLLEFKHVTCISGVNKVPLVTLEYVELQPSFHHRPPLLLKAIRVTWPAVVLLNIDTAWMYKSSFIRICKGNIQTKFEQQLKVDKQLINKIINWIGYW